MPVPAERDSRAPGRGEPRSLAPPAAAPPSGAAPPCGEHGGMAAGGPLCGEAPLCGQHGGDGAGGSSAVPDGARGQEPSGTVLGRAAEGMGLLPPAPALSGVWKRVKQLQGCQREQSSFFPSLDFPHLRHLTGSIGSVFPLSQEQQFTSAQPVQACPRCSATLPFALMFLRGCWALCGRFWKAHLP